MLTKLRSNAIIVSLITFIILLFLWEVSANAGLISATFFPQPTRIAASFAKLVRDGSMLEATLATLQRFGLGVLFGALLGAVLGLMMGWWPRFNNFFSPWVAAFYPVPKIAIFPLLMVIFGIGEGSKFVAILLGAFFPQLITTLAGVQQINRIYFEVGQNYGVRGLKTFTHILLPGSLPSLMAGLRMAVNTGFVIAISVEVISARSGLGVLLWFGWQTFRVSELYAVLVAIAILGILINFILDEVTKRIVPWLGE